MFLTALVLASLAVVAVPPAAAHHIPCFSDYDHGMRFQCAPDVSNPTCITWHFYFGEAYLCPRP